MQRPLLPLILGGASLMITLTGCVQEAQLELDEELAQATSVTPQAGLTLKGKEIEGTSLDMVDEQGRSLTLKISGVELDPKDKDRELYLYTVLYQDPTTSEWQNLCEPDKDGVTKAIPLSGQWDATGSHVDNKQITFACTNGVLAKCARWGYKPWKTVNGKSLRDYHQTCTRMARADYCGNGIGHTKDGTAIDLYDRLKIQKPTSDSGMVFEAAWNPEGAVFLNRTRYPDTFAQLQQECPEKLQTILREEGEAIAADIQQQVPQALLFNNSFTR